MWCFLLGQTTTLLKQLSFRNTPCSVFDTGWECITDTGWECITMPPASSPGVDISPESCQSVLWRVASSTRTLTCFTAAAAEREQKRGKVGDGSRGKRKWENRTQNSICSGLDGSFFSLERTALNPICASCQLCPTVPSGGRTKRQMVDKLRVGQVKAGLTRVRTGYIRLKKGQKLMLNVKTMIRLLNWIVLSLYF